MPRDLAEYYTAYVSGATQVSTPDMAVSYELARYVFERLKTEKPASVLDMGSGFSSLVFAVAKQLINTKMSVLTVDTSREWLEKSKRFLEVHQVSSGEFITWHDFETREPAPCDFMLFDLGRTPERVPLFSETLRRGWIAGYTTVIVDDMHKLAIAGPLKTVLENYTYEVEDIRTQTLDEFGRFSVVLSGITPKK